MAGTKGKQSVRDMVLSMAVIGVVVAGIYLFIPHDDSADPVKRTDYTVELATARRAAPYPVAAPEGLPESWTATSVRYRGAGQSGAAWHLGFLDPERQYIGVEQSDAKASVFIDAVSQGAKRTDATEDIGGESWQRYAGDRYNALVREAGGANGATTVVTGSASWEHLAQMAKALRTN